MGVIWWKKITEEVGKYQCCAGIDFIIPIFLCYAGYCDHLKLIAFNVQD